MSCSKKIFCTVVVLLFPVLALCQDATQAAFKEDFRLPGNIWPIQHYVQIYTSLAENDYRFWGSSTITIECKEDTNQIILHSSLLTIVEAEVSVSYINGDVISPIQIDSHEYNTDFEFYKINVSQGLVAGTQYSLFIPFSATLEDGCYGYFRTSYEDCESGQNIWFAATYMDAGKARTVFPCFDEPEMKTIFSISLGHVEGFQSLSNMQLTESYVISDMEGWVMDIYADTPPMSTYLVAFMISNFEYIELQNLNVPVRIWARKDSINQMKIVETSITTVFPYFNQLFQFNYPLNKLDFVAVPLYQARQESFGCIMMDEDEVLYNPKTASIFKPITIAADVSHLLAHQWFGCVVSISWWSEVWMTDGFAFYFQEEGLAYFMSIDSFEDIRFAKIHRTEMNDDSLVNASQALVAPIECASDLIQNLTTLSYNKGYFVLRMLNMILSPDVFLQGIVKYLQTYQFAVATQFDFFSVLNNVGWEAQTLATDIDLNTVMEAWTKTKGYPMITVDINYEEKAAYLSQIRFLSETGLTPEDRQQAEKQCWSIPINYITKQAVDFKNTLPQAWLTCDTYTMLVLENITDQDWIIVNLKTMVPARVNYPENNWLLIANVLLNAEEFAIIDVMNRMQIVSDSFEIAWPGYLSYKIPITIAPYLAFENAEQPWKTALLSLRDIRNRLKKTDLLQSYHAYVRTFIEPKYSQWKSVDLVPNDITEARLKLLIDSWACTYGVEACLQQSLNILMEWYNSADQNTNIPININVRETVLCYGIQEGNRELWNFLLERFTQSTDSNEKCSILYSLGCSKDENTLMEFLQMSLDPNRISPEFSSTVFFSVCANEQPFAFNIISRFLMDNFQTIFSTLADDTTTLCSFIYYIGDLIETQQELQDFQVFLDSFSNELQICKSDIEEFYRQASNNISWHNLHDTELAELLANYK